MKRSIIAVIVLPFICLSSQTHCQVVEGHSSHRVADALGGGYIGGNKIAGDRPKGYEDFLVLWVDFNPAAFRKFPLTKQSMKQSVQESLYPDSQGRIAVGGRVVFKGLRHPQGSSTSDGEYLSFEFSEAYLIDLDARPIGLIFDTAPIDGVHYHFEGKYVDDKTGRDGVHLEGTMRKLRNGEKLTETDLSFVPYNIIE